MRDSDKSLLDLVRGEIALRSCHLSKTATPEDQADYALWSAHDEEKHEGGYAVCTICAGRWHAWYLARAARKAARWVESVAGDQGVAEQTSDTLTQP